MQSLRRFRRLSALCRVSMDDCASQIAEFAVSLPLLVVFAIGIFDFSSAITIKQKLTNAARDAARVAAADPANDLSNSTPPPVSVVDAFWVVDNYLISENMAECGLHAIPPTPNGALTWTSTVTCPPGGANNSLVLTINRGYVTQQTLSTGATYVVNTQVTIRYPYAWQFGGVAGFFGQGFILPSGITTAAVAFNEN
jgi:hypothetical protein